MLDIVVNGVLLRELIVTTDLLRSRVRSRLGSPLRSRDSNRESNDLFLLRFSASLRSLDRPRYTSSRDATLAYNSSSYLFFSTVLALAYF